MTESVLAFLASYGYVALMAVGFAEFAGVPLASVPVLVAAGGLGASAGLHPVPLFLSAALGGLVADIGWYLLVRWKGEALVDAGCGLTSNPHACVLGVEERVARLGPVYVVLAKFVPGAGNLVAPAAALARMEPWRFVVSDGLALVLWAGAWTTVGRLFASEIHVAVRLVERYQRAAVVLAVGLLVAAVVWRVVRVGRHREAHADSAGDDGPGS